jgi:SH3 domain protein
VRIPLIIVLPLCAATYAQAGPIRYATDDTYFSLRSGKSLGHRVVQKIRSGTPVEMLEQDTAAGWAMVRTQDGGEGWMQIPNLMEKQSARERLPALEKKLADAEIEINKLATELRARQAPTPTAAPATGAIEAVPQEGTAGPVLPPVAEPQVPPAAHPNDAEKEELERLRAELEVAKTAVKKEVTGGGYGWFFVGAGVALVGMLLGRLTAHTSWGRD